MRCYPLIPSRLFWIPVASIPALSAPALADWGENWGAMLRSSSILPVPGLEGLGVGLLAALLVAASAGVLRSWRPASGLPLLFVLLALPLAVVAGTLAVPNSFVNGTPADAGQVNANFDAVETEVNDNDSRITTNAAAISANATAASDAAAVATNAKTVANTALADAATAAGIANQAGLNAATAQGTADSAVANAATAQDTATENRTRLNFEGPHQRPGANNTAVGELALRQLGEGDSNVSVGYSALCSNNGAGLEHDLGGDHNTAVGNRALWFNLGGFRNTAVGSNALHGTTYGNASNNTAVGANALYGVTSGTGNLALGDNAGANFTTGSHNIAIASGVGVAGESHSIRLGTIQSRAFIAGIFSRTTGAPDAVAVFIDSNGQLSTASSSGRYKEAIEDMGAHSAALQKLRPVTFRYKKPFADGEKPLQYGLIAEEVAAVFPDLVVFDEAGEPETVKYHLLSSLLLNELQQLSRRHEALKADKEAAFEALKLENAAMRECLTLVEGLSERLAKLEAQRYVMMAFAEKVTRQKE